MANSSGYPRQWTQKKQRKLDCAVRLTGWLLFAASCLSWLVYSVPLWITVCICFTPWVALFLVTFGNGRFRLVGPDNKTVLNIVLCVPMGVMIGALLRYNIIDWQWPLAASSVGGALFLAWCFAAAGPARTHSSARGWFAGENIRGAFLVVCVWLVGAALSWATIIFANGLREAGPQVKLRGTIIAKSLSGGKSRSYYLHFSGEPTELGIDAFRTSRARYDRTHVGDKQCVIVGRGLLGLRYYGVNDC